MKKEEKKVFSMAQDGLCIKKQTLKIDGTWRDVTDWVQYGPGTDIEAKEKLCKSISSKIGKKVSFGKSGVFMINPTSRLVLETVKGN